MGDTGTVFRCDYIVSLYRSDLVLAVQDHVRRMLLRVLKATKSLLSGDASFSNHTSYGQPLQQEWEEAGRLYYKDGFELEGDWEQEVHRLFGDRRLYGGAQYFRVLDEFRWAPFTAWFHCRTMHGSTIKHM